MPDYVAATNAPMAATRIGIDRKLISQADASVQKRLEAAIGALETAGCTRVDIEIDNWQELDHLAQLVQLTEAAALHARFLRHRVDDYGPQVRTRVEFGHFVSGHDYQTAVRARGTILQKLLDDVYSRYFPRLRERHGQAAGLLSGGEQQMLAIGRALMASPKLLMLDEPSLGLSPILVIEIFEIIKRINQETGAAILVVEQNAQVALDCADFGYIMELGRVVMADDCDALRGNPDVQEFYLGVKEGGIRGQRRWRRRKTWR